MADWIDYYDTDHTIYVSAKHRDVHFAELARDLIGLLPSPDAVVLDYACGEALGAPDVAAACHALILAEPAPSVRARLARRFAAEPKISVRSLDDLKREAPRTLDLALMNSVSQYMTASQLEEAFSTIHRLLKPNGTLIVGDVLRPDVGPVGDAAALLGFAARHGFLVAAFGGLIRTALSDYRKLRSGLGVATYTEAQMLEKLAAAGFVASRAARNIGHNPRRMSFVGRPNRH